MQWDFHSFCLRAGETPARKLSRKVRRWGRPPCQQAGSCPPEPVRGTVPRGELEPYAGLHGHLSVCSLSCPGRNPCPGVCVPVFQAVIPRA